MDDHRIDEAARISGTRGAPGGASPTCPRIAGRRASTTATRSSGRWPSAAARERSAGRSPRRAGRARPISASTAPWPAGSSRARLTTTAPAYRPDHLHMGVAEAEFAFRIGRDLRSTGAPFSIDDVMARVHRCTSRSRSRTRASTISRSPAPRSSSPIPPARSSSCSARPPPTRGARWISRPIRWCCGSTGRRFDGHGGERPRRPANRPRLDRQRSSGARGAAPRGRGRDTGTCVTPASIGPGDELLADFGRLGTVGARLVP